MSTQTMPLQVPSSATHEPLMIQDSEIYETLSGQEIRLLSILPNTQHAPLMCQLQKVALGDYSTHDDLSDGTKIFYRWTDGSRWELQLGEDNNGVDGNSDGEYVWIPPPGKHDWEGPVPIIEETELEVPRYEALSYTWGDPAKKVTIFVNQQPVDVGENLFNALIHLRKEDDMRVFWIDALCINQNDDDEKLNQIQLMRDIYQRAWRTTIWLGVSSSAIDYAITLLERLGGAVARWGPYIPPGQFWGPQYDRFGEFGQVGFSEEQNAFDKYWKLHAPQFSTTWPFRFGEKEWDAFDKLLHLPWWTRIWIVQEVANSQTLFLQSGSRVFSWQTLEFVKRRWCDPGGRSKELGGDLLEGMFKVTGVMDLMEERKAARVAMRMFGGERADSALVSVVWRHRKFNATNSHDHVFAMVNLANLDKELRLPIPRNPYKRPAWELFSAVAKAVVYGTLDFSIICLSWDDSPHLDGDWPSWVPNLAGKSEKMGWILSSVSEHGKFRAAGDSESSSRAWDRESQVFQIGSKRVRLDIDKKTATIRLANDHTKHFSGIVRQQMVEMSEIHADFLRSFTIRGVLCNRIEKCGESIPPISWENETWTKYMAGWEDLAVSSATESNPVTNESRSEYINSELLKISKKSSHTLSNRISNMFSTSASENSSETSKLGITRLKTLLCFLTHIFSYAIPPTNIDGEGSGEKLLVNWLKVYLAFQGEIPWPRAAKANAEDLASKLALRMRGWKFATTKIPLWATVPDSAAVGDLISLVSGADVPIVLRRVSGKKDTFRYIGPAFVGGLMFGEIWEQGEKDGTLAFRDIILV